LEGLANASTHHPTTSPILAQPSRHLPLHPNTTPRIYPFSTKQSLRHTKKPSPIKKPFPFDGALNVGKKVIVQDTKTIQSYFTRVSQIKEHIEAIGDSVEEVELMMTTLNGLSTSWESFIQGIFSRRKLTKFSRLWEDYTQA
jgi:hypothetical protein